MNNKIYLIGMMGAGKSYSASRLAKVMGVKHFDLDELIVNELQKTVRQIFQEDGEEFFREAEKNMLEKISKLDAFVLATGGGTPCFHENMQLMNKTGTTVWIDEPLEILYLRLKEGSMKRPLLADLDDEGLKTFLKNKLEERRHYYEQSSIRTSIFHSGIEDLFHQLSLS